MSDNKISSALQLITHVWDHALERIPGHSRIRTNESMRNAVFLAINAGLKFDPDDLIRIAGKRSMHLYDWVGVNRGECWYTAAIKANNATAIKAYEKWRGRKPFLIVENPGDKVRLRLHIGARFYWADGSKQLTFATVTSFAEDQSYAIACAYTGHESLPSCKHCGCPQYAKRKIKKRFKITHKDIREYHAAIAALDKSDKAVVNE